MTSIAISSDEAVEVEYDSDTFDEESIEEQFSKRNYEGPSRSKVSSDNENIESENISYESEDEVYEFSEDEFEEEEDTTQKGAEIRSQLGKEIGYEDFDKIDELVNNQMDIINEKVRKRLQLITPPKKQDSEKSKVLETPTTDKKQPTIEVDKNTPLKQVKNFNEMFLQESDKLRAKTENVEEVRNKEQDDVKYKLLSKERKMQIKTVAQVHKDGNELEKIEEPIQKEKMGNKLEESKKSSTPAKIVVTEPINENPKNTTLKQNIEKNKKTEKINVEKTENKVESSRPGDSKDIYQDETDEEEEEVEVVDDDDEDDEDVVIVEPESSSDDGLDMEMRSHTPSSMRSSDYAYHLNFIKRPSQSPMCPHHGHCKPPNRRNMSFSNLRLREIERQNEILLKKILTQKPSYMGSFKKTPAPPTYENLPSARKSSAEINRKKQQRQIDLDNLVLKKKIEAIAKRRSK